MNKIIAADARITEKMLTKLKSFSSNIILVPQNPNLDTAVSAHPDMNILQIKDKLYATFDTNVRFFENIKINKKGKKSYPEDVFLNAVCIGNDFICKTTSIEKTALEYAQKTGMRIINVNQGYVKCNISVVCEKQKAIITEDEGIRRILESFGYDVLKLESHEVKLDPYDYGFIGGASGLIENKLLFTGNIHEHKEYCRIKEFCEKYSVEIISLSDEPLYDYGSLLVIN